MNLKYLRLFIVIAICWSVPAQSNESTLCKQALTKAIYLQEVGAAAEEAKKIICSSESKVEKDQAYYEFLGNIKGWFDPYGGFDGDKSVIDTIQSKILKANIFVQVDFNINGEFTAGGETFKPDDESKCIKVSRSENCAEVIEEFRDLFTEIHRLQVAPEIFTTVTNLQKLRTNWDPFLEHMKGQTWLELLINGYAYKNNTDTFSGPPSSQWIILHPTLLIENVSTAVDGENTQEALGLEIIGMNWWKQDKWYIPSGASVLAVYSDRADIKDTGYGVALHFLSDYTVGYTNHDGEDGFFVSVDVIKLFQDKKNAFESYKSAFD